VRTTSAIATGCERVSIQRGVTITGSRADAVERLAQARALDGVALARLDVGGQVRGARVADERAHAPPARAQLVEEMGVDVAGRAGEENLCHRSPYDARRREG
jgi:hypothetical protein